MRCGIPNDYMLHISMYKMHFIHSYIKNMYIKLSRSAINCKAQPNVCVNGEVEFIKRPAKRSDFGDSQRHTCLLAAALLWVVTERIVVRNYRYSLRHMGCVVQLA